MKRRELKQIIREEILKLIEIWDTTKVMDTVGNYGINSSEGKIYIKKSTGKNYVVKIGSEKFNGSASEVANWMNKQLGLTETKKYDYYDVVTVVKDGEDEEILKKMKLKPLNQYKFRGTERYGLSKAQYDKFYAEMDRLGIGQP